MQTQLGASLVKTILDILLPLYGNACADLFQPSVVRLCAVSTLYSLWPATCLTRDTPLPHSAPDPVKPATK